VLKAKFVYAGTVGRWYLSLELDRVRYQPKLMTQVSRRGPAASPAIAVVPPPASPDDKLTYAELYNPLRAVALYCALALIFVRFSMIHELIAYRWGISTPILYILGPMVLFGFLLTGGRRRTFSVRSGWYWVAFALWMFLAIPFSSWRGGSTKVFYGYLRTELPMLLVAGGLVLTWKEFKRVMVVMGLAAVVNVLTGRFFMSEVYERLTMGAASTSIGNSNDYAAHMILVLPFLLWVVLNPKRGVVFRLGALGAISYGVYMILATGSRGGLVALIVAFLFIMFRSPGRQRLGIIIAGVVGLLSLPAVVSPQTLRRVLTFSANSDMQEAVESQEIRQYTLKKSIEFTVTHPIFGIGPGQFRNYEGKTSRQEGKHGAWLETHNTYMAAMADCGIPAGIAFMLGVASTFLLLNRVYRQARGDPKYREIAAAALCMMTSMVGFAVAITFLTKAYWFYLPAMTGLAIALNFAAQREFRSSRLAQMEPQPAHGDGFRPAATRGARMGPKGRVPRMPVSNSHAGSPPASVHRRLPLP
jgi:O-antigen ligase